MSHRSTYRPRTAGRGFTLIELTLAALIAAMLSLTLYSSLSTAMRSRKTADAQVGPARRAAIALDLIEADLQSITPVSGSYNAFTGLAGNGADSVTFYAIGRDRTEDPTIIDPLAEGVRSIQIGYQTEGQASPSVVRRVTRNLLSQTGSEYEDEVLVDNVRSLVIRYYDSAGGWSTSWDTSLQASPYLPQAVEVTLELNEPGARKPADGVMEHGYRVTRLIPIAVAAPAATDSTETTGGQQ